MSPIETIRKHLGLSRLALSKRLGVTGQTVANWERKPDSIRLCDVHAIIKLATEQGIHLSTYDFVAEMNVPPKSFTVKNDAHYPIYVTTGKRTVEVAQGNGHITISKQAVNDFVSALTTMSLT